MSCIEVKTNSKSLTNIFCFLSFCNRFYVNLQKGKTIYPHPQITLHFNSRIFYGVCAPYVVMNCWKNGSWEHEERHEGHLSWMPGRDFLLT